MWAVLASTDRPLKFFFAHGEHQSPLALSQPRMTRKLCSLLTIITASIFNAYLPFATL